MTRTRDEWAHKALGDVARVYSGGTPSRANPSYWGGTIPWATTTETESSVIRSTKESITQAGLENSSAKIAPTGTLLMAMYGQGKTRGKTSILGINAAINQACAAIEPGPEVNPGYLLEYLQHHYHTIRALSNSGGQENLTGEIVKKIPICLPSLAEQVRIFNVAGDITSQALIIERLLVKKRAIKRGVLQQLFTGKIRLPGFRDKSAEVIPLASVTTWLSGGTPNRSNDGYWSGSIPWISATSLKGTRIYDSDQHVTAEAVRAGSKMAPAGATLMLVRGMALHREVRAGLALRPVSFNQDVKALIPRSLILPEYVTYALHARRTDILELVSSAGSGTGVLDTGLLKRLSIWLPDLDEQQLIVDTVNDLDAQIETLERRLAKTKAEKQGMMQELSTGRTRLLAEDGAA